MVIPLRSGRLNHPLGLAECRRHSRHPPVLRRDPRAVTTAAPLRHRAGGAGSRTSSHPRTTTLPLGSQQNASPFCDPLRCRVCACRIGTCRLGLITVWLPVRVLPAGCNGPFAVSAGNEDRPEADWGPSSLASEIRFPVRGEGPVQIAQQIRALHTRHPDDELRSRE